MSKVLKTAALIAGAVAIASTGIGAIIGPAAASAAGSAGIGSLSVASLGTYAAPAPSVTSALELLT